MVGPLSAIVQHRNASPDLTQEMCSSDWHPVGAERDLGFRAATFGPL
jgi:hypothetical protein